MAWTQADLDALDAAIATGAIEVEHPVTGKVRYRSLQDMMRVRQNIADALAGNATDLGANRVKTGMLSGFRGGAGQNFPERMWP